MTRTWWMLLTLGGCADMSVIADSADSDVVDTGDSEPVPADAFYLSVEPAAGTEGVPDLLPQVFGPFAAGDGFELELLEPVRLRGVAYADKVTPVLSLLPTEPITVQGTIELFTTTGELAATAQTEADGSFSLFAIPDAYMLGVSPFDPQLAARSEVILLQASVRQDLHLDPGAPVWGRVLDGSGVPIRGAPVFAVSRSGVTSGTATTDSEGWYELRVEPDLWTLTTTGRTNGRDPTLQHAAVDVADGARVDLIYPTSERGTLSMRVLGPDGQPARGQTVRLTSIELTGFEATITDDLTPEADSGSFRVDLSTDSRGDVLTTVPSGTYSVEVLPGTADALSPFVASPVDVRGNVELGDVGLKAFTPVTLRVTQANGAPLDGAAVRVSERTSAPRTWHGATVSGVFQGDLPDADLEITVLPPGAEPDLAAARVYGAPAALPDDVVLPMGEKVGGTVTWRGAGAANPLPYAIVRVLDGNRTPWGYTLTDDAGRFAVNIDRASMQPRPEP